MKKLRYYYGTMNSMKSSTLLMKAHQFEEAGCKVFLLKPSFDTRDSGVIRSRALKHSRECIAFSKEDNLIDLFKNKIECNIYEDDTVVLFFDEVNFMTSDQVEDVWLLSKYRNVDIFCYGLKLDYKNEFFESALQFLKLADTVEEIKSMCSRCNNKASTHMRIVNGEPIFEGESEIVGDVVGEERYISVCQQCWFDTHYEYLKEN